MEKDLFTNEGRCRVTSTELATKLGVGHNKMLKKVRRMKEKFPEVFNDESVEEAFYYNKQNAKMPMFVILTEEARDMIEEDVEKRRLAKPLDEILWNLPSEGEESFAMIPFKGDKDYISSIEIAQITGRTHFHVMRDVREMLQALAPQTNTGSTDQIFLVASENGSPCEVKSEVYRDKSGSVHNYYTLNKKACLLLATGYNAKLRLALIERWEALEVAVRTNKDVMPLTQGEALLKAVEIMVGIEKTQREHTERINALEERENKRNAKMEEFVNEKSAQLDELAKIQEEAKRELAEVNLEGGENIPELEETQRIIMAVNDYCRAKGVQQHDVWRKVYKDLYYLYHIRLDPPTGVSKLQEAKRRGVLDIVRGIVARIVR